MRSLSDFFPTGLSTKNVVTIPNILTMSRIIITPIIAYTIMTGYWSIASLLFLYASLTDLFDGYVARLLNQKTFLGTCLDPIADKLLLVSCFAALAYTPTLPFSIPLSFLYLILFREIVLIVGAAILFCTQEKVTIQPTYAGKVTTAIQMLFIMWLFTCYTFAWFPTKIYYSFIVVISTLIIITFIQYGIMGIQQWHKK